MRGLSVVSAPEACAVPVGLGLLLGVLVGCSGPCTPRAQQCGLAGLPLWAAGSHPRDGPLCLWDGGRACRRLLPSQQAAPRPGCSAAVLVVPAPPAVDMLTLLAQAASVWEGPGDRQVAVASHRSGQSLERGLPARGGGGQHPRDGQLPLGPGREPVSVSAHLCWAVGRSWRAEVGEEGEGGVESGWR